MNTLNVDLAGAILSATSFAIQQLMNLIIEPFCTYVFIYGLHLDTNSNWKDSNCDWTVLKKFTIGIINLIIAWIVLDTKTFDTVFDYIKLPHVHSNPGYHFCMSLFLTGGAELSNSVTKYLDYAKQVQSGQAQALTAPNVVIGERTVSVLPQNKVSFTAAVKNSANTDIKWGVQESNGGSIDSNGIYTAPVVPGIYHIVVSTADGKAIDVVAVTVNAAT